MKIIALLLTVLPSVLSASPVPAAVGRDYVLIIGAEKNLTYQCTNYYAYFETSGHSLLDSEGCVQIDVDFNEWPVYPPQSIRVTLLMLNTKLPHIHQYCKYVSHSTGYGDTSTVVDCRP